MQICIATAGKGYCSSVHGIKADRWVNRYRKLTKCWRSTFSEQKKVKIVPVRGEVTTSSIAQFSSICWLLYCKLKTARTFLIKTRTCCSY